MLQTITTQTVGNPTHYTDISNNIRTVKHSVLVTSDDKKETEEHIVEELYRIFTHKVG